MNTPGTPERSPNPPRQGDRPARIRFFTDRYDWMGPVIVVLSSWYFAAQVLVAWVFRPHYSFVSNVISDLGNTSSCPSPPGSSICSPLHLVMDGSLIILGLAMVVGSILIFTEFSFSEHPRERAAAIAGFTCMALGGLGAALVGAVPENVNTAHLHTVGTALAIGFGQLAIVILGLLLIEIDNWLREFMIVTSLFVLLAGISIAFKHQFGIGEGALERLAQYPESVWLILFGLYISRDHYRKGLYIGRDQNRKGLARSGLKFSGKLAAQRSTLSWALGKPGRSARRITPAPAQASATSAGEHAATGVIAPEPPAEDGLAAARLQLAALADRVAALEREAGHWQQAQAQP
jgi:hypothetical membrane protein